MTKQILSYVLRRIAYYLLSRTTNIYNYQIERRTNDQQVAGSTPARHCWRNNLRQVVHTLLPLSSSTVS